MEDTTLSGRVGKEGSGWRGEEEEEEKEVSFLCRRAVWDLPQDDDASALSGPDLLSTRRHLDLRQRCGPIRGEIEDESGTLVSVLSHNILSRLMSSKNTI